LSKFLPANQNFENISSNIVYHLLRLAQIDRAVAYSILGNISSLLIGAVSVFLIANYFSLEAQGYYYAFAGFSAIQFILELGLGQTAIPFASHEWAYLGFSKEGLISGNINSEARLFSLGRILFKWYTVSAGIVILGLTPAGYLFFSYSHSPLVEWTYPWIVLCLLIALNLAVMPIFYLLQGCNQVASYGFYRFIQQLAYGAAIWVTILLGGELWALPAAAASILIWNCIFIWKYQRNFLFFFFNSHCDKKLNWWREIWPIQWRTAISWTTSNFTTVFFAPILFQVCGPVIAGQMGMSVAMNNILLALASSWVVTKLPHFGILIETNNQRKAKTLFLKSFLISLTTICLGAFVIWCLGYLLYSNDHPLKARILPPFPMGVFLLGTILNCSTNNLSIYLRAYKSDPLAILYLVTGILILAMAIFLGNKFGSIGITSSYFLILAFIQFPFSLLIFLKYQAN